MGPISALIFTLGVGWCLHHDFVEIQALKKRIEALEKNNLTKDGWL